ncbi:MAG: dienelactone hydrolase family protein [Isosphaeraceae bacterium]
MKHLRLMTLTLILLLATHSLPANDLYQPKSFKNADGKVLPYRIMLPEGYKADDKTEYPLVLFLHGAGERGNDNAKQLVHGAGEFAKPANRQKYPAIVVAPQCPSGSFWTREDKNLMGLLDSVRKDYRIDARRIYVTGLSMGGFGTWSLIAATPTLFAAAAPICGGGSTESAGKLVNLPIWVFHGDADTVVKPDLSRNMVKAIEKAGGKPKYTEYAGVGHDSWTATYANPDFIAWLFSQKKP